MKKLLLLALSLLLCACAGKISRPDARQDATAWGDMQKASAEASGPYRLQLSMRFGEEGDTRRVTGILWGNGGDGLRLDVMAGVGALIARVAQNGNDFLVYAPRENRAYTHNGPERPLLKIGVPAPFDLLQLADILTGRFAGVFGTGYESASVLANGNQEYELADPVPGLLELNARGEPLRWRQKDGGWKMELTYAEDAPFLPASARFNNLNGKMAVILVKEREKPGQAFDTAQLQLLPPAGVRILPLASYKAR